jgi:hypothetical protein
LEAATSAGTISKTDETAISGALDDIGTALSAEATGTANGTQATSGDMKSRIQSLIDQEVKDGKLTDSQASELKDLFGANTSAQANAVDGTGANGQAKGPGGVHHGHHHHKSSTSDDSTSSATSATASASSTDSPASKLDTLISLLQNLRDSMTSTDTYGTSATSANSNSQTALLIDKSA